MVIRRLAGRTVVTPLRITVVRVRDANEKTAPESRRTFRCDIKICQCPIEHRRVSGSTVARWFSAVGFRRSKPKRDHGVRHPRDDARRRAVAGPRPAPPARRSRTDWPRVRAGIRRRRAADAVLRGQGHRRRVLRIVETQVRGRGGGARRPGGEAQRRLQRDRDSPEADR